MSIETLINSVQNNLKQRQTITPKHHRKTIGIKQSSIIPPSNNLPILSCAIQTLLLNEQLAIKLKCVHQQSTK